MVTDFSADFSTSFPTNTMEKALSNILSNAVKYTQNVLPAVQIDAEGDVHRLLHHLPLAADMVVDGVQEYHRINALQRPLLLFPRHGENLVRNPAHCCV